MNQPLAVSSSCTLRLSSNHAVMFAAASLWRPNHHDVGRDVEPGSHVRVVSDNYPRLITQPVTTSSWKWISRVDYAGLPLVCS
jgi:hypothetical protein